MNTNPHKLSEPTRQSGAASNPHSVSVPAHPSADASAEFGYAVRGAQRGGKAPSGSAAIGPAPKPLLPEFDVSFEPQGRQANFNHGMGNIRSHASEQEAQGDVAGESEVQSTAAAKITEIGAEGTELAAAWL